MKRGNPALPRLHRRCSFSGQCCCYSSPSSRHTQKWVNPTRHFTSGRRFSEINQQSLQYEWHSRIEHQNLLEGLSTPRWLGPMPRVLLCSSGWGRGLYIRQMLRALGRCWFLQRLFEKPAPASSIWTLPSHTADLTSIFP